MNSSQNRYDTVEEFSMKLKTFADEYEIKKNTAEELSQLTLQCTRYLV